MTHVLRMGHRPQRDKRVTTHVCLVARAFGASGATITTEDAGLVKGIASASKRFGGSFAVDVRKDWKRFIQQWDGPVIHLTMYGEPLASIVARVRHAGKEPLIVVGAEKVPRELYELADFNVSVTGQPHSEVAALALTLDRLSGGEWEREDFTGGETILPRKKGKLYAGSVESGKWPSREECLRILADEKCPDKLMAHVRAVERRAVRWAAVAGADIALVRAGALLHDIGRTQGHGIDHGFLGHGMLKERKLPDEVCRIALTHVFAGISREEAPGFCLPAVDLVPKTLEEKLVCHADTLTDGAGRGSLADSLSYMLGSPELLPLARRMVALHTEIEGFLGAPPECL